MSKPRARFFVTKEFEQEYSDTGFSFLSSPKFKPAPFKCPITTTDSLDLEFEFLIRSIFTRPSQKKIDIHLSKEYSGDYTICEGKDADITLQSVFVRDLTKRHSDYEGSIAFDNILVHFKPDTVPFELTINGHRYRRVKAY